MVMAVVGGPPERSALQCAVAEQGKEKLCRARSGKSAVRKIAVIEAGNGKHAHGVGDGGDGDGSWAPADPYDAETSQMDEGKGCAAQPLDAVFFE